MDQCNQDFGRALYSGIFMGGRSIDLTTLEIKAAITDQKNCNPTDEVLSDQLAILGTYNVSEMSNDVDHVDSCKF